MKLFTLQEKLKKGFQIIERISPKSFNLPILNTSLIKAKKNFLNIISTDLEIAINWWLLAKVEEEGEIAVPFSLLSNFLNLLPNKNISIIKKDKFLLLECDEYKIKIKGFSSEEFPIIPNIISSNFIEIEALPFCQGLEQVVDIAVFSQARPEISGIYLLINKEEVKIVATDSFRLAEKTLSSKQLGTYFENVPEKNSFIIPYRTVKEIINIFNQKEGKIKIYFSLNQIMFERQMTEMSHPEVQLISRLIEGEYPFYQEIIPKKHETQIILNKDEFLNQLKIASFFSGKINEIKLKVEPKKGEIEIFSQNTDLGEHHSFLKCKIKGEPIEVSFNHKFLIHGLSIIKNSEIIFELNKEEGPAILKPVNDPSFLYVVMPIKAN